MTDFVENLQKETSTASSPRVEWVDKARGLCIFLVVMMHTTLGIEKLTGDTGWMHAVVAFAQPFRMPDFFLISGLFLAATIDRPWRLYLDRKVVHSLGSDPVCHEGTVHGDGWSNGTNGFAFAVVHAGAAVWNTLVYLYVAGVLRGHQTVEEVPVAAVGRCRSVTDSADQHV